MEVLRNEVLKYFIQLLSDQTNGAELASAITQYRQKCNPSYATTSRRLPWTPVRSSSFRDRRHGGLQGHHPAQMPSTDRKTQL